MWQELTALIKQYPLFGLWLMGVISYFGKSLPGAIYQFLRKQFTVILFIENNDPIFDGLITILEEKGFASKARTIKSFSSYFGGREANTSIGYGNHYFWMGWTLVRVNRQKDKQTNSSYTVKETLSVTSYGRSQKFIRNLLDQAINKAIDMEENQSKKKMFFWKDETWTNRGFLTKRNLDTIVMDQGDKERIVKHINSFNESLEFYQAKGIPYRTGILLEGPPGSGKTSLARALATHFDRHLYTINLAMMDDESILGALAFSRKNSIILIEDCDTTGSTNDRAKKSKKKKEDEEKGNEKITLGGLLNALDGVFTPEGRIVIMTTNHPEKLDAALIRPGRCDLRIHMGYADSDMASQMYARFFEDKIKVPLEKKKLTTADLERAAIENINDKDKFLQFCKK